MRRWLALCAVLGSSVVVASCSGTPAFAACPAPALRPARCLPVAARLVRPRVPVGNQGVDVSDYQRSPHWTFARNHGLRFAYIQLGDGLVYRDRTYTQNIVETRGVGLRYGSYLFLRPGYGVRQGRELGEAVRATVGEHTLPPALDAEVPGAYQEVCAAANAVRRADHWSLVVVYTAPGLWVFGVPHCAGVLWVADYGVLSPGLPYGWSSYVLWQYQEGSFPGLGTVDRDVAHGVLTLTYGRTVLLPQVEQQRHHLQVLRVSQDCRRALRYPHGRFASHVAECRSELAKGVVLTRRAKQLTGA